MTNALTAAPSGGVPAVAGGNPFLAEAEAMGASSGALYVKFDGNTGVYSYGADSDTLEKGTEVAINPNEFKRGWICWKDGEVMGEVMVRIIDGPAPAKDSLEDHGPYDDPKKDGWREQSSIAFRDVESGEEFIYKTSSKSGRIGVANLIRDYGKAFQQHPGELAIVEVGSTSFDAKDEKGKKLGKKYAPVFKIVRWEDEADLIAKFEAAAAENEGDEDGDDELPANTKPAGRRARNY